mgnify:FL=1
MLNYNLTTNHFLNSENYLNNLIALLGPTNTGKTYYAIERMLQYNSGIIGFPLRLLAREVYDKLVNKKGLLNVALITGEERIVPKTAKYFICTVEAMPRNLNVDFVAIDEIQLCTHNDRGHIFTDKILNHKGEQETMFLGSDSIEILLKYIYPNILIKRMQRFSTLKYTGKTKLTRIPRRSAIVSFSINDVYEIAELVKRKHGGTAVVLGALSPKTRNAQVELYESGEVDYLVATDAIGMGLNMDINNVFFAKANKFDGRSTRPLTISELAQIAGRAGRYKSDGCFGITAKCVEFSSNIVNSIENHIFPSINTMVWRNSNLDFSSLKSLLRSLSLMPNKPYLTMSPEAEDERLLKDLSKKPSIINNLLREKEVKLLWEICSIPDYSKNFDDSHSELLEQIYLFLIDKGEIPENWVNKKLDNLNNIKGELDLLGTRLANVRTWNYISNHKNWINSKSGIPKRARYIENRLSDALHEGLIERFVDYKMAKFSKSLDIDNELVAVIDKNNSVLVEGHHVGRLEGFSFVNEVSNNQQDKKEVLKIVRRTLYKELKIRVANFQNCKDSEISFDKMMNIYWKNNIIAKLIKGSTITNPKIFLSNFILLDEIDKSNLKKRLSKFVKKSIASFLSPITLLDSKDKRAINGVIYQLNESLGAIKLYKEKKVISNLSVNDIEILMESGVKIGELFIWVPKLFEKRNREYLWSLRQIFYESKNGSTYPSIETIINKKNAPKEILNSNEFILIGENYYNFQLIEKIAKKIKEILKHKKIFFTNKKNSSYFSKKYKLSHSQLKDILHILNFKRDKINPVKYIRKDNNLKKKSYIKVNKNNSPFAVLEKLTIN